MKRTKLQIMHGDLIPWGWGIAYYNYTSTTAIILPIPINWLVGWSREAYFVLAQGPRSRREEQIRKIAFEEGRKSGKIQAEAYAKMDYARGQQAAYERMFPGYQQETIEQVLSRQKQHGEG